MKRLTVSLLLLLVGCGTPQEQCIRYNTRDLRTVDRLIAETQGNLERGYAIEKVTEYEDYWGYCAQPRLPDGAEVSPRLCMRERAITVERPKAIDLNDEARKLDSLQVKRKQLASQAEAVIAQCRAEHPE